MVEPVCRAGCDSEGRNKSVEHQPNRCYRSARFAGRHGNAIDQRILLTHPESVNPERANDRFREAARSDHAEAKDSAPRSDRQPAKSAEQPLQEPLRSADNPG